MGGGGGGAVEGLEVGHFGNGHSKEGLLSWLLHER